MEQKKDFLDLGNALKFLWKYYIAFGLGFLIFGVLALFHPEFFAVYIISVLGWFFVFGGIGNLVYAVKGRGNPAFHWGTVLFLGVVEMISGFFIITNPIISLYSVTIYIGVLLIFRGFSLIFAKNPGYTFLGIQDHNVNGLKSMNNLNGILDVIFGAVALIMPFFAEQVFLYTFIFYLIFGGLMIFIYGFQVKHTIDHQNKK